MLLHNAYENVVEYNSNDNHDPLIFQELNLYLAMYKYQSLLPENDESILIQILLLDESKTKTFRIFRISFAI